MVKANVYLSDFSPDNMKYLIELLEKKGSFLKTYYYEVSFNMNKTMEISNIKEIEDILSYLEVIYKNRSIIDSKLDYNESMFILGQLYKQLNSSSLTLKKDLDTKYKDLFYDDIQNSNESTKKESIIDDSKNYIKEKSYINNYLKSKKDNKDAGRIK